MNSHDYNQDTPSFLTSFVLGDKWVEDAGLSTSIANKASIDMIKKMVMFKMPYLNTHDLYTAAHLCGFDPQALNREQTAILETAVMELVDSRQLSLKYGPNKNRIAPQFRVR